MLLYATHITPRLQYAAAFCGTGITGTPIAITGDLAAFEGYEGARINYSHEPVTGSIHIVPNGLLSETGIGNPVVNATRIGERIVLFPGKGDLGFDLFSAIFFLLSRYEEYQEHEKDEYGRFAHTASLAYREGFLQKPVVNQWLAELAKLLIQRFPAIQVKTTPFIFQASYDIDMAWSYRHKGWWRNTGGWFRSVFSGDWKRAAERWSVLRGTQKDPYDAFGWMNALHERLKLRPYYFFLLGAKSHRYDKNISPAHPAMNALVHDHAIRYPVGIHPSWRSGDDPSLLASEIKSLEKMSGTSITASRQHYIRFNLPEGYRKLISNGIRFDFSMGYGSINGFRASVASPFYWYDLEKEQQTELMVFPFCFMDANSFYEQKHTADQALEEMRMYHQVIKGVNGFYCMIWHNSFLGTERGMERWKQVYEEFLKEI